MFILKLIAGSLLFLLAAAITATAHPLVVGCLIALGTLGKLAFNGRTA